MIQQGAAIDASAVELRGIDVETLGVGEMTASLKGADGLVIAVGFVPGNPFKMTAAARTSRSAGPCGSSEMPAIAAPPGREQPAAGCPSSCRASATGRDETGSPGASARARELEDRLPSGRADSRARALETRSISGSAGHGFSRAQQRLKRRGRQ